MKPNVLFLVLDALPYDRCYGKNKTSVTPNLDSLISNGVKIEQAISNADETVTAFGCFFTSQLPFRTGLRQNQRWSKFILPLDNNINFFKQNGFHPYATVTNLQVMKEIFSDFNKEEYPYYGFRLYDGLGNQILNKITSKQMKEPWFYFIHLVDTHKPVSYPTKFDNQKYGLDEFDKALSSIDVWLGKIFEVIDFKKTLVVLTADHGDFIRSITQGNKRLSFEYKNLANPAIQISKLTPNFLVPIKKKIFIGIRSLITKIRLAKLGRTLTIHEKRILNLARAKPHNELFEELIRIPLILSGYGVPSNKSINCQISSIDIFPTIFEIIGLPDRNETVDGRSFYSAIKGKKVKDRFAYIETSVNKKDSTKGGCGIRTPKYKYFRDINTKSDNIHLYDLQKDPFEEINLRNSNPEIVKNLEKMLDEILQSSKSGINDQTMLKELTNEEIDEVEEELRKLGYV